MVKTKEADNKLENNNQEKLKKNSYSKKKKLKKIFQME